MHLQEMFGDVKFVCMGGSSVRAGKFAHKIAQVIGIDMPDEGLLPIGKTERCSLYKIGPVISVSHGMGMPSMLIFLHELTKLMEYAKAENFTFIRIGTSGGVGIEPGTVVVTNEGLNEELEPNFEQIVLGQRRLYETALDTNLANRILSVRGNIRAEVGKTMGTNDFYEGQARLDGALAPDYTEAEKLLFLQRAHQKGVRNIEMESTAFAAFCKRANIPAAIVCATLLNRLNGDQVTSTSEELAEFSSRAENLVLEFIKRDLSKQ
jgi:uridine phosphorylase